jgi:hypothetical protein
MSQQSPALIEYVVDGDSYELCAEGGWLAAGLKIAGQQDLFEADGFKAADGWFQPLGGAVATITFATEEEFADHPSAQAAFSAPDVFDGVSLFQATGTLRFTIGATVTEWENAVMQSVTPNLPAYEVSTLARAFAFTVPAVQS